MLNYANLCIQKALLVQQNQFQILVQMELATQQATASMNTNFHTVIASLQALETRLSQQFATQMQSDIHSLRTNYQSFCHSSEAWWADSTTHLSNLSATTNLVSQTAQTLTTTTQTIAKKVSTIEQTTTQVRSQ